VASAEFLEERYPERPATLRARWRVKREAEHKRHAAKEAASAA